jgi:DNA helicase II / ATP-dependent DNA helicase PcrA
MFEAQKITPTVEQKAIQTSDAQVILVHANAGAAKTTSLALRIAEGLQRGINPSSILALTYTEPACDALRTALLHIGVAPDIVKRVWISSFERFAAYCLKSKEGSTPKLLATPEAQQTPVWAALTELRESASEDLLAELVFPAHAKPPFGMTAT